MSKKKQTISELPSWFDIKNYAAVSEFDIFDWHWNIHYRLSMTGFDKAFEKLLSLGIHVSEEGMKKELEIYAARVEELVAKPAMRLPRDRKKTLRENNINRSVVRDMSAMDAMSLAEELHKDEKYSDAWEAFNWDMSTTDEWIKERLKGKFDALEDSASDFINVKYPASGNLVYAEIDIHAPLDDLVDSFCEWIKRKKSERNIPFHGKKKFSELDLKRWHKYAVLPYFDLKLWADVANVHIPDFLYVKALFSDVQGDIDGMFRKNTKPLEKQVMTQGCLDQLRNQGDIHY
jgi:hypothetical protein